MANHGSKFMSVNLNKSYGQHHQPSQHANYPHFNGPPTVGRGRPGSGGGGGMLVLSRARGAPPKVVPKLSVPPPLNLPSLRKEHEKFDLSGSGGPGAGAGTGSGSRPTSSGMGWTKPVAPAPATALPEKNESVVDILGVVDGTSAKSGPSRAVGSYMPPSARSGGGGAVGLVSADRDIPLPVDNAVLLRGEDFPSLQAARPVSSGTPQKQKDGLNQKHKHVVREELDQDKESTNHLGPVADMHPVGQATRGTTGHRLVEDGGKGYGMSSGRMTDQIRKQEEYFPDPLPLVRMNPRSDWADDERDTGHGFVEQGRDTEYSSSENYWDRDFDLPRPSILPHKPALNQYDNRWGQRDNEAGKRFSSEVLKVDRYYKDVRASSREDQEVNKWKNSRISKDGFSSSQETGNNRVDVGSRMASYNNNNMARENKFVSPHSGEMSNNRGRQQQQQQRNNTMESFNNNRGGVDRNPRHVTEQPYNKYRGDNFQSNNSFKSSFASGGKMLHHVSDPLLNMGRDKLFSNSDRDFGSVGFDERDLLSEGLVGVIKRKKDAAKLTDFHDPIRESFEAELERVQKMQELERQRIIEEQERALEQARREEEERLRRIREEDERRRKIEEEAREAMWRAEQERVEAIRRAEELRISREEEKKRIELEEERRKIAAKQKLEELEAKIAMRQADGLKGDVFEKLEVSEKENNLDLDTWEDSERMVVNVMNPGSFDSSSLRPYPKEGSSSSFTDRGKASNNNNPWKRDGLLENGGINIPAPVQDQETGHYSPRRDAFGGGRGNPPPRKEFYGGPGYIPSRGAYLKPGMQELYVDEFGYHKDQNRWNLSGNIDPYGKFREMDPEFHDGIADRHGDNSGWGQGRSRVHNRPPYPDRLYSHSEATNDFYNYGRSRYSMRQPRVPPPPSVVSSQRPNPRVTEQHGGPSNILDNDIHYTHAARNDSTTYYESNQGGLLETSEIFGPQQENDFPEDQNLNNASRCDSQSSLSVSSPPTSPPHLSHDELDESGESRLTSSVAEGKRSLLTGIESVTHNMSPDNVSAVEDEEWSVENDNTLQMQEEYDEDEDGYKEDDEVRERDDENIGLSQNFEGLELEESESPHAMDNVVLGFDEGVEVVLSNDDFEKNLETEEQPFEILESSVRILEEKGTVDDALGTNADSSSANVPEKNSGSQGCIGQHVGDLSDGTGLAAQQTTSSNTATTQTNNNMPSLSSSQGDLPVKLQFGLFSGPSLIPSPVPAIQIGSIQMPLHNYPPIGQSVAHMHPSQPSMFQFGQLHYTSPISQGILPMAPQSVSFLQPSILGHINLNQNAGGSVNNEPSRENVIEVPSLPMNNPSLGFSGRQDTVSNVTDDKAKLASDEKTKPKSYLPSSKAKVPESQSQHVQSGGDRNYSGPRGQGLFSGSRGRRIAYAVKNTNTRVMHVQDNNMPPDSNGFQRRPRRTVQRTEFRVRENNDKRLSPVYSNNAGFDDKPNYTGKSVGVFTRSGSKRSTVSSRTMKSRVESEASASGTSQEISGDRPAKEMAKDFLSTSRNASHHSEANSRINASEEDVDAPLQSGVVRVFKQPGIEAPSDEDDFIEVRSKRQMLNDRREQREKEIKAKSRPTKLPRKQRASRPKDVVLRSYNKLSVPFSTKEAKSSQLDSASESPHFANNEVSSGYATAASQPPIGTPPINSDAQAIKSTELGSVSAVSNGGAERDPVLMIDSKNKVMSLSQSQIDEAMKPALYDSHISTVGGNSSTVSGPILPTPPSLPKDKTFSSGASPINSLLAGERIQFGAVTSPTVLPPSTRVVSHGIGAPGSNRPDAQLSHNFPVPGKDDSFFFSEEKHLAGPVQDCEAEAAASAVAVAAISSDEIVGNGLGSVNDTKSYSAAGINGIAIGVVGPQQIASQSQSEELLSVSLPADLSVETTPISLWPPLPSPQGSSSQMLSHFPRGPHSHFPFYEMNPLLGGPIFAFSPHEEPSGAQSHPSKSSAPVPPGPMGNWPQCHSGMDSFYGAPAGYSGHFIGPPGGIPGVQGPPHMVVYNHFAPYGQVGLSFMGTTYIPSGKQADWKSNVPTSSGVHNGGEGEINNVNMSNVQRSGPNMTAPIQHLAPGSPLLPMPPPMPMFDVSPFQAAPDFTVQARWGHIPASPLHSIPVSGPLQQPQIEGSLPSQVNHGHPIDQSVTANSFMDSRTPTQSDNKSNSPNFTGANVAPFPSQLGLADSSSFAAQTSSGSANSESSKTDTAENSKPSNANPLKTQFPKKKVSTQHVNNNAGGYGYQRGGPTSHRNNNTGNEFSHRRMGYHGRNQSSGVDNKGFHTSKVKQIYVAKQTPSGGGPAT